MTSKKIKLVFMGTPEFSCPFLEKLISDDNFDVQAVITQPDQTQGRKHILTPSPVKNIAIKYDIPVFQPIKLNKDKNLIQHLKTLAPDFILVVAYGQMISQEILDIPAVNPINVHGSVLPAYRGASPIEESILRGDKETGLSIMQMVLKMDAGPVYKIIPFEIEKDEKNTDLRAKMSNLGSQEIAHILTEIKENKLLSKPQEESLASFCHKITKEDGVLQASTLTTEQFYNRFRAYYSWPGIAIELNEMKVKVLNCQPTDLKSSQPGNLNYEGKSLFIDCLDYKIEILELQTPGKNPQTAQQFLNGYKKFLT